MRLESVQGGGAGLDFEISFDFLWGGSMSAVLRSHSQPQGAKRTIGCQDSNPGALHS